MQAWFAEAATDLRTPLQLEREKYTLWHPASGLYRPWMAILPCVVTQGVLGSFYSTSVYNKTLDHDVWGQPGVNSRMFVACVAFYGLGTLAMGSWIGRHGVFASVRRSLILTPLGWLCASLAASTGQQWLLYAYGLLHGLGCAHAYISTTSCLTQWYPKFKGFISGLAVFGAGAGSLVWTLVGRALMDPAGLALKPAQAMLTLSIVFLLLLALALPFLRNPPPNYKGEALPANPAAAGAAEAEAAAAAAAPPPTKSACPWLSPGPAFSSSPDRPYTFLATLRTGDMRLTFFVVFAASLPGVVFLSSAADMAANIFSLDGQAAGLVTAYLNLSNFTGRFLWGWVTDKIGRKSFWLLTCVVQGLALLVMSHAILQGQDGRSLWMACFLLIGSLYGGLFGVLPAFLGDMFGSKISSAVHGAAIFMWSCACVIGAPIFSAVNARYALPSAPGQVPTPTPTGYAINALWLSAFPLTALLAVLCLNVRREDRRAAARTGTWRVRCCAYMCIFKAWEARVLNAQQQEEEYSALGVRLEEPEAETQPSLSSSAASQESEAGSAKLLDWPARLQAWEDNR